MMALFTDSSSAPYLLSCDRLLQVEDSPTPSRGRPAGEGAAGAAGDGLDSPLSVLMPSPLYLESPGIMSLRSQSPPLVEAEAQEAQAGHHQIANSELFQRICFDRVNAAAACLASQVTGPIIQAWHRMKTPDFVGSICKCIFCFIDALFCFFVGGVGRDRVGEGGSFLRLRLPHPKPPHPDHARLHPSRPGSWTEAWGEGRG